MSASATQGGHKNDVLDQIQSYVLQVLTRTVQPVATCRQSPYVHKPAIVKLLLLIYGLN